MSEIYNAVNKETAEKLTTNRDSTRKHINIYLMRGRRIVIEGCEDHKYCYWLSKQKLDDVDTNADILALTMYGSYDYVAHSVYLFGKLNITQKDAMDGLQVTIEKVVGENGIRFKAPWGTDSVNRTPEENGRSMAKGLVEYYDKIQSDCRAAEKDATVLAHFDEIEKFLDKGTLADYSKARKLIEPMWKWEYFRLSENDNFRFRYDRLRLGLDRIYNSHMSLAR